MMTEEMIGEPFIISIKKWEIIKQDYPLCYDKLDEAIVKELDDKTIIVEKGRMNKIIKDCYIAKSVL